MALDKALLTPDLELYEHRNPMAFEAGAQMEIDLAADLSRAGYTVTDGH